MTSFTSKQREIIDMAKERGFVTAESFIGVYSSPISRKSNIERLLALGILTYVEGQKLKLNKERLHEIENGN